MLHRAEIWLRGSLCHLPDPGSDSAKLDLKMLALVSLAALVALGCAVPSCGAEVDAAGECRHDARQHVEVLVGAVPSWDFLALSRPSQRTLALAFEYDINDASEQTSAG